MALSKVSTNQIDTAATPTVAEATVTGDLTVDTNTLKVDSSNNRVGINEASPTSDLTFGSNSTIEMVGGSSKLLFKRPDTTTIAGNPLGAVEFSHTDTNDAGTAAKIIGEGDGSSGEGRLAFHTGTPTGISERMRITSGGDVGIGTSSPTYKFQVAAGTDSLVTYSASALDSNIFFDTQNTSTGASAAVVQRLITSDVAGTGSISADIQKTKAGALNINNNETNSAAYTAFGVGGSERMRIDSSGNLLVADTTNVGTADHKVSIQKGSAGRCLGLGTTVTTATVMMSLVNGNGTVGTIQTNGSATSYVTSSDHRLKENVSDMTGAIDRVKALAPKRFNWIADPDDTTVDGFLAHEAQAVVPEAVTGTHNEVDDDGNAVMQGIDQSKLVPLLTTALKESIAKIETLETKVAALETFVDSQSV